MSHAPFRFHFRHAMNLGICGAMKEPYVGSFAAKEMKATFEGASKKGTGLVRSRRCRRETFSAEHILSYEHMKSFPVVSVYNYSTLCGYVFQLLI